MLDSFDTQELLGKYILREEKSPEFMKSLVPSGKLTHEKALKVYRNDYVARLTSVLGENYPATWVVLGDELFFMICEEFIKINNSSSYDIGEYGDDFYRFLGNHPIGREFPFLQDLAFLEKNFLRIFHSPTQKPCEINLSTKDPSNLTFKFIQGVHFQKSKFPIYKVWSLKNLDNVQNSEANFNWQEPTNLVLYKNNLGIRTSFLKEGQIDILINLFNKKTLAESLSENITPLEVEEVFGFISSSGILLEIN